MKIWKNNDTLSQMFELEDYDAQAFIVLLRYYTSFMKDRGLLGEANPINIHRLFTRLSQALASQGVFSYLAQILLYPDSLISNKLENDNDLAIMKLHTTDQNVIIDLIIQNLLKYKEGYEEKSK